MLGTRESHATLVGALDPRDAQGARRIGARY